MCVNGEEMLHIDRFMIDIGILSYSADFPAVSKRLSKFSLPFPMVPFLRKGSYSYVYY